MYDIIAVNMEERKVLYSAIQPTNNLTIGNLIGAIKNWTNLQNDYDCYFAIANMHAITVRQVPAGLRQNTLSILALYLAWGIDPSPPARPRGALLGFKHLYLRRRNAENDAVQG